MAEPENPESLQRRQPEHPAHTGEVEGTWRDRVRQRLSTARQGLAHLLEGEEGRYARARASILARYAAVTDPEAKRMTSDVFEYMQSALADIRHAPSDIPERQPLGTYRLAAPSTIREVEVTGSSQYDNGFSKLLLWQWDKPDPIASGKACQININYTYEEPDRYLYGYFANQASDVSVLARLMPPDQHSKYANRQEYKNEQQRYHIGAGWTSKRTEQRPHYAKTESFFIFDERHIPALQAAVNDVLAVLQEKQLGLQVGPQDEMPHTRHALQAGNPDPEKGRE